MMSAKDMQAHMEKEPEHVPGTRKAIAYERKEHTAEEKGKKAQRRGAY